MRRIPCFVSQFAASLATCGSLDRRIVAGSCRAIALEDPHYCRQTTLHDIRRRHCSSNARSRLLRASMLQSNAEVDEGQRSEITARSLAYDILRGNGVHSNL
ncbi:hypothetical protein PLICRDRAFT_436731 [Plicaturopsis crispa FD-325 SS-3]|uniref:Uncharacterized protein n=1 Tax=Plicaturopsis crispa FD-325 SS-3 TaxID=944288 RepID=A0A0C9SWY6_PLICR|nr:hypothetical protein PLICRDRAFT_436731 [Plicaturopsis crispa FD-325 SS-3]